MRIFLYKSAFRSFFYFHVTREKLPKRFWYKKRSRKMLMKLTTEESIFGITKCAGILAMLMVFGGGGGGELGDFFSDFG